MTTRERMVWEQAVRVLRQNSVIATVSIEPLGVQRVLAKARERADTRRRA
jgi:Trk K+ transport system NAD-binding subunit